MLAVVLGWFHNVLNCLLKFPARVKLPAWKDNTDPAPVSEAADGTCNTHDCLQNRKEEEMKEQIVKWTHTCKRLMICFLKLFPECCSHKHCNSFLCIIKKLNIYYSKYNNKYIRSHNAYFIHLELSFWQRNTDDRLKFLHLWLN